MHRETKNLQRSPAVIDPELLDILVCPETKEALRVADDALLGRVNAEVAAGRLKNRGGEVVERQLEQGLVREDGQVLYPVWDDIPVMLLDEAVSLEGLATSSDAGDR